MQNFSPNYCSQKFCLKLVLDAPLGSKQDVEGRLLTMYPETQSLEAGKGSAERKTQKGCRPLHRVCTGCNSSQWECYSSTCWFCHPGVHSLFM